MGPGSAKAEVDEAYLKGWQVAVVYANRWRDLCHEARDERDVALRRVAELERRAYDYLEIPEGMSLRVEMRDGKRTLTVYGEPKRPRWPFVGKVFTQTR